MRYWIEVFQREFMNLWRYMMISFLWLLLRIYESIMTIYERLWELWSLYDFNWEIDDVYKMWKSILTLYYNPMWSMTLMSYIYDYVTLWPNVKERRVCLIVMILTKVIMLILILWVLKFTTISSICPLMFYRVSCWILT